MHPLTSHLAGAASAPVFLSLLLAAPAQAQLPTRVAEPVEPAPLAQPAAFDPQLALTGSPSAVMYDEPGDGALWARGDTWKAKFDEQGTTWFPREGPRAPRNAPHTLSPDWVTLGGEPLSFSSRTSVARSGDRVELDRGSFVEAYELAPNSIEQLFVFESLPRSGELVVHIPIASELTSVETADGLEFRNERGRMTYSRAVAIDGRGARFNAPTKLVDGSIVIHVGAEFLANAQFPLVIDPILTPIFPDSTTSDTFSIDAVYDDFNGVWMVSYEQVFSATDNDVLVKCYSQTGTLLSSGSIDLTSLLWTAPRIGYLNFPHRCLVVAEVATAPRSIKGRIIYPNGTILTTDSQFDIGGAAGGDKIRPDVGGDPFPSASAYFCVVWEHVISGSDHRIKYALVTSSSTVLVGPLDITTGGSTDTSPSISKSNGTSQWLVAWNVSGMFTFGDVYGAHIMWSGSVIDGPFGISTTSTIEGPPCVSSPLLGTSRYAVTYTRGLGNARDVYVSAVDGPTVLQTVNLQTLENSGFQAQPQIEPSVDSDGYHFMVSYSEFDATFGHNKLFVSDLALSGSTLVLTQSHLEPQPGLGLDQRQSNMVAARATSGSLIHRYLAVYNIRENDQDHDVAGRFIEGLFGGTSNGFCFGDGSGSACPCGNSGSVGHGCANSIFAAGAQLTLTGSPSTLNDTAQLQMTGIPPGVSLTIFQGTTADAGTVFGDGLRCATGTVIRIVQRNSNPAGALTYPLATDPMLSVSGGIPLDGGQRTYQAWYRNAASFCTSSTFNLSNGLLINWAR
jgi:hypothetical protein